MAKAIANCVCEKCGKKFERTETKRNRKEADSWTEWAEHYYDTCHECWEKEKSEELRKEKIVIDVSLEKKGLSVYSVHKCISRNAYARRTELKSYGFTFNGFNWEYRFIVKNPEDAIEKEKAFRDSIIEYFNGSVKFNSHADASVFKEVEEKKKKLGEKPKYPEEFEKMKAGKNWNHVVYRGKKESCVYLDGVKVVISKKLADEIEAAYKKINDWNIAMTVESFS